MIELLQQHQEITTLVFSAVVALSTVVYAVLTALLVKETRQMRRAQTEPKLVAFVEPREEFINFAHLYFENVGSGPAFDVSFELSANKDDEGGRILISDFSKSRFLKTGVDYIGSSQRMQSHYTRFTEEFDKKIKAIFSVTVKYKSSTNRKYSDTYTIDMSQFEGAGGLGTPHMYSIAQSLKKLQEDVHKISSGFNRVKVNSYTHEDRVREEKEWEEYRNEQIAKSKANDESA
ncbi:MAG: hypothetical protein HWD86_09685 [Kangiellaceae bacterium]|nr:hypothetical protein [Kangiellaceae bacterium]